MLSSDAFPKKMRTNTVRLVYPDNDISMVREPQNRGTESAFLMRRELMLEDFT